MRGVPREGSPVASKYEFIDEMRLDTAECAYSGEFMCGRLGVSRSGYYDWRSRPESATAQRREELKLLIKKAFDISDSTYGHRCIQAQLHRWGISAGLELVRRLMRELGLEPCQPQPKRFNLTKAAAGQVPDLVGRNFTADAPGEKLVGDITYIVTGEGWLYLATVIDCCTKEVIGYAMDPTNIQGDPQRGTEQEPRGWRGISLRPRKQQCRPSSGRCSTGLPTKIFRPPRDLFRQCNGRIVLRRAEERACIKGDLPDSRSRPAGHHSVHRILVQSQTPPFGGGLPPSVRSPRRVREVANRRVKLTVRLLSGKR